jgi:hypothetical protein
MSILLLLCVGGSILADFIRNRDGKGEEKKRRKN